MEGKGLVTGLIDSIAPRLPRMSEVLFRQTHKTFDSIAALPSNVQAIESTRQFVSRNASFVALVGPSGWGKSHLLESASTDLRPEFLDSVQVLEAAQWAMGSVKRDPQVPLILDNVQDVLDKGRVRTQLRLGLERRVRAGRPTLLSFTAPNQNRAICSFLPNAKDWILSSIQTPVPAERELVVRHLAEMEGLQLSEALIWLLGHRIHGNGRTLTGALKRLRLQQQQWLDPAMTLKACGVLDPFFADNSSWDLREHISSSAEDFESEMCRKSRRDLALFTMLRVASLAECDIARYFDLEPAKVYSRARLFEQNLDEDSDGAARAKVLRFIRYTIGKLRS
jgi:hypothetical protein